MLDFIASRQETSQVEQEVESKPKMPQEFTEMSQDQLLLELTLPIGKNQPRKSAITERPKTDRRRSAFNNSSIKIEDLDLMGKKYVRTSQLTTKRNNRPATATHHSS